MSCPICQEFDKKTLTITITDVPVQELAKFVVNLAMMDMLAGVKTPAAIKYAFTVALQAHLAERDEAHREQKSGHAESFSA